MRVLLIEPCAYMGRLWVNILVSMGCRVKWVAGVYNTDPLTVLTPAAKATKLTGDFDLAIVLGSVQGALDCTAIVEGLIRDRKTACLAYSLEADKVKSMQAQGALVCNKISALVAVTGKLVSLEDLVGGSPEVALRLKEIDDHLCRYRAQIHEIDEANRAYREWGQARDDTFDKKMKEKLAAEASSAATTS